MIRKQRVGKHIVRITSGRDEMVGIGARWDAYVDGKVTVIVDTPHGLLIGTTKGAVSRLETVTGRRCALATLGSPITGLAVVGRLVTVTTAAGTAQLLARSLKPPKPRKRAAIR